MLSCYIIHLYSIPFLPHSSLKTPTHTEKYQDPISELFSRRPQTKDRRRSCIGDAAVEMNDTRNQSKLLKPKLFLLVLVLISLFFCIIFLSLQSRIFIYNYSITLNDIKIRPGYTSYDKYIHHQLHKTTNPKLRKIWTTRDWDRKIRVFAHFFTQLKQEKLLSNSSKALCIGARMGQEVEALKRVGVNDSIGLDLVPYPPNVIKGDFHHQPFNDSTFDFEFSNVFDHALYPEKFVGEIQRTLKPGGICVLHVALSRRSDKYSANDLYSVEPLKKLFNGSDLVQSRKVDGFGLDTEVVFRKKKDDDTHA